MRKIILSCLVAASGLALVPATAAAASPVMLTRFTLDHACVQPGQTVNATVTLQNTTVSAQNVYAQDWVSEFGQTLQRGSVMGPYTVPPLYTATQSQSTQIPTTTPYGYYTVTVGIGPSSSSPTSWGQLSTSLIVSPLCLG